MITSPAAAAAVPSPGHRTRWLAAAILIVGALMDMIDLTIVNVALPTIRRDLGASATQLEWVISGYMLAFAAALIIAGGLGDLAGRKRIFLVGVALFGLASLGAGLARSPGQLIGCRVIQGLAAAAMTPQVLATFRTMFAARERGQAFGIYGAMLGLASAIGLVAGGVLTEASLFGWSWRSVFFVNVPVAVAALAAGLRFIPETRDRAARRPDLAGGAMLAGSLIAVVYPLLEGRQNGWAAWTWLLLAAGLAGLVGLGVHESRRAAPGRVGPAAGRPADGAAGPATGHTGGHADGRAGGHTAGRAAGPAGRREIGPLLQPRLLRIPAFAAGLGVQFMFSAGLQGFFLTFALWLQAGQHFSPLRAGLTALAFSVGSFVLAPFAVPLAQRYGRGVLAAGGVLMAAGVLGVAVAARHVPEAGSPWVIVPGLAVAGTGLSLLVIPLVNVALAAVPARVAGGASGLFGTAQQLGGAVGVAVVGTVFFAGLGRGQFVTAFIHAAPYTMGAFAACALLSLLLPRTAVSDAVLTADDLDEADQADEADETSEASEAGDVLAAGRAGQAGNVGAAGVVGAGRRARLGGDDQPGSG